MSRHTLFVLILFLLFLVGIGGIYLYRYANLNLAESQNSFFEYESNRTDIKPVSKGWINDLAKLTKREYVLPVNEIFIEYKRQTKMKDTSKTAYELFINKNDVYSMFCLTQTLKNSNVDFTIVKDGVKSQIFLNTQDSELLQKIILELRTYDIDSSVMEVKI